MNVAKVSQLGLEHLGNIKVMELVLGRGFGGSTLKLRPPDFTPEQVENNGWMIIKKVTGLLYGFQSHLFCFVSAVLLRPPELNLFMFYFIIDFNLYRHKPKDSYKQQVITLK